MSTQTPSAYHQLTQHFAQIHRFEHLASIASWDRSAMMPPAGHDARTAALTEVQALLHAKRTQSTLGEQLARAEQEPLDDWQRANLREMHRAWRLATALPDDLVRAKEAATSHCEHAWRTQRAANDWAGFAAQLREVVRLTREEAARLSDQTGLSHYDSLMDQYEPGMTSATIDTIFGDLRSWLPGLIDRVMERQSKQTIIHPQGPFDLGQQRALSQQMMRLLDFDMNAGRLDESAHPFSGGVPEDVRMTTRYKEEGFIESLMGTVHETGHGRYEQNRPRAWIEQPVSQARSMGIHESQSLSFEMQLGSHPGFAARVAPMLQAAFGHLPGNQGAFTPENLWRLITRTQRGLIRVDADEVTYPAHVILRYEIERALIEGAMEVDDIPAAWDERMQSLLRLDTRGNFKDGPMQDVHWPSGAFGYFPCYTLGAMYAAQWFATMRRQMPMLDDQINAGQWGPIFAWLKTNVWEHGSRYTTDELARRISGETLNPLHYRRHLEARYLGS